LTLAIATGAVYALYRSSLRGADEVQFRSDLASAVRPSSILEIAKATMPEYFARAESVVVARSAGTRTNFGPGGNIFTFFAFDAETLIKGSLQPRFEIRLLGGTIGDATIPLPIDGRFETGAEYLLMLGPKNADGHPTLNPAAVYIVRKQRESGRKVVVPCGDGLPLYDRSTGRRLVGTPDWCFLDDLVYSLTKAR
jgi:hypothetical protein